MAQGDNFRKGDNPSYNQLLYMMELDKIGQKRGYIAEITKKYNVHHASVSRFFKICREKGYIDDNNEFTLKGRCFLYNYDKLISELKIYLTDIGVAERDIEEKLRALIENLDFHTLTCMVRNNNRQESFSMNMTLGKEAYPGDAMRHGSFKIYFTIFQYDMRNGVKISMADQGFYKPAKLTNSKGDSNIFLRPKEMIASSRVNNKEMKGIMSSLKYEDNGVLCRTTISADGLVAIPLRACKCIRKQGGEIRGQIPIIVTCSVGGAHMPESTALLVFWL